MLAENTDGDLNAAQRTDAGISILAATSVQDDLTTVMTDLERLQALVDDASSSLMTHFHGARVQLLEAQSRTTGNDCVEAALQTLAQAITSLQFQDMATQMIGHTTQRLRHCADCLARDALRDEGDEIGFIADAVLRPNPVTQNEMGVGPVELF